MRSKETRKNQGNLEAAVEGNSHGGLAGMVIPFVISTCESGKCHPACNLRTREWVVDVAWSEYRSDAVHMTGPQLDV